MLSVTKNTFKDFQDRKWLVGVISRQERFWLNFLYLIPIYFLGIQ